MIDPTLNNLAFFEIAPWACQFVMSGPKTLCVMSQA